MGIYQNIKKIAKRKNITHKQLAEQFKVTDQTMTNYLTGRTKIIADQVPLFAKALRVSIEELFIDDYFKKVEPGKSNEPVYKYYECPECISKQKEIDALKQVIEAKEEALEMYRDKKMEGKCG